MSGKVLTPRPAGSKKSLWSYLCAEILVPSRKNEIWAEKRLKSYCGLGRGADLRCQKLSSRSFAFGQVVDSSCQWLFVLKNLAVASVIR